MAERKESCEHCRFWDKFEEDGWGWCMRFPPQLSDVMLRFGVDAALEEEKHRFEEECYVHQINMPDAWHYPVTVEDHWCGEFQPREE